MDTTEWARMLTYVATNRKLQHFIICTLYLGTLFEPHSQFDGCSNLQIPRARTHPWWRSQFTVGRGPGGFHVQRGMSGSDSAELLCWVFTRPDVLCNQDRGSLFYTDLNHMQILCISLQALQKPLCPVHWGFLYYCGFHLKIQSKRTINNTGNG